MPQCHKYTVKHATVSQMHCGACHSVTNTPLSMPQCHKYTVKHATMSHTHTVKHATVSQTHR
jgi:hypothetical protein